MSEPSNADLEDNYFGLSSDSDSEHFDQNNDEVPDFDYDLDDEGYSSGADPKQEINRREQLKAHVIKLSGKVAENLPRIPMTASMERASFELQMTSAVVVEREVARSSAKNKLPKDIVWSENKDRLSPFDIIRRGLEIFEENHPDMKLVYEIPKDRIGEIDFLKAMGKIVQRDGKLPLKIDIPSAFWDNAKISDEAEAAVFEAYTRTEGEVQVSQALYEFFEQQKIIKQEELFAKALELSNGHIVDAIDMVAEMTKAVIRPDWLKIQDNYLSKNEYYENLKEKVLDQLSDFVPFGGLPARDPVNDKYHVVYDYSCRNRLGQVYHMWDIIKLTKYFTPELIRVMVSGEYAIHFEHQGNLKLLSDLRVLADLYKIQDLFKKETVRNA